MKKNDNVFVTALKAVVRLLLRVFYGKKHFRKKEMHEINFLAPKSDYAIGQSKRKISA